MNTKNVFKSTLLMFFVMPLLQASDRKSEVKNQTAYDRAAVLHLPSLAEIERNEIETARHLRAKAEEEAVKNGVAGNAMKMRHVPSLGKIEMLRLCYNLFSSVTARDAENLFTESIFNNEVFTDMTMFCGEDKNSLDLNLAKVTDHTQTCFGKVFWQSMFTQNVKDLDSHIKTVQRRQEIVKYLVENEELFAAIEKQLKIINQNSEYLLWFNKELSAFEKDALMGIYWKKFASWNESEFKLGMAARWYLFPYVLGLVESCIFSPFGAFGGIIMGLGNNDVNGIKLVFGGVTGLAVTFILISALSVGAMFLGDTIMGFPAYNQIAIAEKHCSKYSYGSANFCSALDELGTLVQGDEKFRVLFARGSLLQRAVGKDSDSKTLNVLLEKLKNGSFQEKPSFFADKGKLLWCFKKLQEVHGSLNRSLTVLGQLDAYMGIARFYKKYANRTNARVCFAEFVKADKPYIYSKAGWYPLLDIVLKPDQIVTNDLDLDFSMILSGPNAAGKSVSLKSVMSSVIFSHVIGIAFADKFVCTPFAKIGSHLNISDDAIRGESLYKAEQERVLRFLNETKRLATQQQTGGYKPFYFVIMDEMFSSTNPAEGEAAAFAIAQSLVNAPFCMTLFATHFSKMKQLEAVTNGFFRNYKVWVDVMPDGSITSPYKVVPGISNQSVAIKMMQDKFDKDIVKNAYAALIEQGHSTQDLVGFTPEMIAAN